MKRKHLLIFALVLGLGALCFWSLTGANRGWTKTSVPIKKTDEVTGIVYDDYQDRFTPGIDFLGAALIVAALSAGASLLISNKKTNPSSKN